MDEEEGSEIIDHNYLLSNVTTVTMAESFKSYGKMQQLLHVSLGSTLDSDRLSDR